MGWTTQNEKTFIDGLVTGKWVRESADGMSEVPRERLLRYYIHGAKKRIEYDTWGKVDGGEILKYAKEKYEGIQ